jgi:hypothetical protein
MEVGGQVQAPDLYSQDRGTDVCRIGVRLGCKTGLDAVGKIESQNSDIGRPARSLLLYRLSYPGTSLFIYSRQLLDLFLNVTQRRGLG